MKTIEASRMIDAPVDTVFGTVADIRELAKVLPHIVRYEFLTEQHRGVGTRFREVRRMGKHEHESVFEITSFAENDHVRLVTDGGGSVWDSIFRVAPHGSQTLLSFTMQARAHRLMARIMNPLIRRIVVKGVESDLDAVKTYCERAQTSSDSHRTS